MKTIRFAAIALAALFVAACLPVTTKNPIGASTGVKAGPELAGIWKGHGDDDESDGYIAFLNNGDETMTAIVFSPDDKNGEWETYRLEAASLGDSHYMNARAVLKDGKPVTGEEASAIFPLLYRVDNGTLTLWLMDEKAAKAAIGSGKIQGTIDPGDLGDVHITAEPAALDAFFGSKEGAALFSQKLLTLHRAN
jgi:hypothetical protein